MATYPDSGPYVPEPTFEAWLEKHGFPETYVSIFDWGKEQLQQEYDLNFNIWDEAEYKHEELTKEYDKQHMARLEYMRANGIEQWSNLDSISQKQHIEQKDHFMDTISEINQERKRLKNDASVARRLLPLIAGVLEGTYQNYEKICLDERLTHRPGVLGLGSFWESIGPLRDKNWTVERRQRDSK